MTSSILPKASAATLPAAYQLLSLLPGPARAAKACFDTSALRPLPRPGCVTQATGHTACLTKSRPCGAPGEEGAGVGPRVQKVPPVPEPLAQAVATAVALARAAVPALTAPLWSTGQSARGGTVTQQPPRLLSRPPAWWLPPSPRPRRAHRCWRPRPSPRTSPRCSPPFPPAALTAPPSRWAWQQALQRRRLIISLGDASDVDGFISVAMYARTGADMLLLLSLPAVYNPAAQGARSALPAAPCGPCRGAGSWAVSP